MRERIIRIVPLILCAHEELRIVEFLMHRIWVFSHRADELQLCTLCTYFSQSRDRWNKSISSMIFLVNL